jgi:hypothetical protein
LPDKDLPAASPSGEVARRKARQDIIGRTLAIELARAEQQEEKDDEHGYHPTY